VNEARTSSIPESLVSFQLRWPSYSDVNASPQRTSGGIQSAFDMPSPILAEKGWYVVRALAAINTADVKPFRLGFSGGTALSRSRLIRRMAEHIDLKVVSDEPRSRPELRQLRDNWETQPVQNRMRHRQSCRTGVEMIEKYYAARIKTQFDVVAINIVRPKPKKKQNQPKTPNQSRRAWHQADV
jgi:hypothetical protein